MRPGAPAPDLDPEPAPVAYTRVTVLAPRRRVDVALPADVPLGELVPMVLELVGEPGPGYRPWRLTGATGGPLHPAATLEELGVLDGELLRIGPDTAPPPPPVFDDPVDALASTAGRRSGAAGRGSAAGAALAMALAGAALLVTVPGGVPQPGPWAAGAAAVAVLGVAGALARASMLVRRAADGADRSPVDVRADRAAAATAALVAVPLAAAAGAVAGAAFPVGAQVLLAAAAAGTVAAAAQVVLRVVEPLLVGVVVAAVPLGVVAVLNLRLGVSVGVLAAGLGAVALMAGALLPRAALRLAGLPLPVVPADSAELMDADDGSDVLPPDELAERADLARGYLAGLVGGCAVLAGASALPAAATGGWVGPALAAVIVVVLGLRARGFADPAPARTLLVVALAAGIGLAVLTVLATPPAGRLLVAGLVVLGAGVAVAVGRVRPVSSPVARRAVDILEGVLVAVAVPLALGAMGLYALVRSL